LRVDDERKRRAGMVCLRNSVKKSGTIYYVEEDKETGLGGESDENPHSRKTRIFWPPENVSTPGWRRKIAKVLRAGDLIAYRVNTRNGIRALSVSQRSNLAMTPITKEIIFLHVE
jgi:hypothetical protein